MGLRSFSLPPATRARSGCWRMVRSKSELGVVNIVSGKPWDDRVRVATTNWGRGRVLFY